MKGFLNPVMRSAILGALLWGAGCRPETGSEVLEVRIDSDPSGAVLKVNGKEVGKTPYVFHQPHAGKYWLQWMHDGFEPLDQMLDISSESPREIMGKLQKLHGLVLFETAPPGAEVSVNGVFRGKAPLLVTDLSTGAYKATFLLEGYDSRELDLEITDRAPKRYQVNMRSIFATLRLESTPPGAAVMIDGIHKGETPCVIENVLVGNHKLRVGKEGFKDYHDEIKLTQTGTFPIKVQLEERLALLEITSAPEDARVTVNHEFKGRTPIQVGALKDGIYTVVLEKPSYEKVTQTVEIKKAQDAKLDVALQKATGTLALHIVPSGATIVINSEIKGVSAETPFTTDLFPGTYKVEVSKAGHRSQAFQANIAIRKTATLNATLQRIWVKDTVLLLKDNRLREGMIVAKYPNGTVKIETSPGIFEEFTANEIQSISPFQ